MARLLSSLVLLLLGAALALGALYYLGSSGGADVPTISIYGDWRLNCPARSNASISCELVQDVNSKQTGEVILRMGIRNTESGEEMGLVVPFGVILDAGLGVALGEVTPRKVEYAVCDETGCRAVTPVDDTLFAGINTRDQGVVVITDLDGQPISLPVSLKGLSDGLAALRASRGQRGSILDTIRQGLKKII